MTRRLRNIFKNLVLQSASDMDSDTNSCPSTLYKKLWNRRKESYKETITLSVGIFECLRYIYKTQGFISLWRGNIANCLRYVPKFALDMALKPQFFMFYLYLYNPMDDKLLLFVTKWFAGASAAIISTIVCYPLDFARTRLATDISRNTRFDGIWDCWKKIIKHDGFLSIYKEGFSRKRIYLHFSVIPVCI